MAPCALVWSATGSTNVAQVVDMLLWPSRCWLIGRCLILPEIDLLPENARSRKVALKVGACYEGVRTSYMFVNGQWRDHESYALLPECAPNGFTARLMGE